MSRRSFFTIIRYVKHLPLMELPFDEHSEKMRQR